ncbi:MEDS domain-containing protein [Nocardioides sp. TF02-7]|uniref:MEDS domain-containing protein n=1 Tax=Nocardioides sp. TF02-7 TaxID=2917724 RepID=UPI001F05859C|nr:MEDS domain-containing protein [Nocardioides sp. TF02-7]UMG93376.1 MEDS domain-containing protein [Nocardioides sp. TF02-7]
MNVAATAEVAHDVLFARSEDEVTDVAGGRLAAALTGGSAAVVIATPEHQHTIAERIAAGGVDPEAAARHGALVSLDAAETLDQMTPDGRFDPAAFSDVVGSVVRGARRERSVHAFGEMVALLWYDDRPHEAVELESAWDALVRETSSSLLCAYPAELVDDVERSGELAAVCGMHSAVLADAPFERSWRLDADQDTASRARRLCGNVLRVRGVEEDAFYSTQSVVTELVANALAHAGSPVDLTVLVDAAQVRVRVGDDRAEAPVLLVDRPGLRPGRGLQARGRAGPRLGRRPVRRREGRVGGGGPVSAAPELDPVHAALASGGHVCLVVDDEAAYDELAAGFLRHDRAAREKHVVVGPFGSGARRPASTAGHVIDPYDDLLGRGALQPGRLIARLRDDAAAAAADGYRRLRVVADLDWLLPTSPTLEEIVALEVLLGRAVADLDATVLCAYRRRSFGPDVLRAVASLHTAFAGGVPPSFTLVAGDDAGWVLSGEVDFECAPVLAAALRATAGDPWVVDVGGLLFADVAGMRAIATVATEVGSDLELRGAPRGCGGCGRWPGSTGRRRACGSATCRGADARRRFTRSSPPVVATWGPGLVSDGPVAVDRSPPCAVVRPSPPPCSPSRSPRARWSRPPRRGRRGRATTGSPTRSGSRRSTPPSTGAPPA